MKNRLVVPSDEVAILALVPRLVAFGPPPWRDPRAMTQTDLDVISKALKSESGDPQIFVAETPDGELAGFIHLHSTEDYYRRKPQGHVADIVVSPVYEGHGIGRALLHEAEEWAKAKGYDWLSISVFEDNRDAGALYEHVGFKRDILRLVKPLGP